MAAIDANKLSVVFLSPHWQCDGYGIAPVTRSLISDLWNTDPEGQGLKVTCMVMEKDRNISENDREDAKKYNVALVGAKLPFGTRGKDEPNLDWLNKYTGAYYRSIPKYQNIDIVIGHVPYLADGPLNIKELCEEQGTTPQIGLVIHSFPQTADGDIDESLLIEWLKAADFVLSMGHGIQLEVSEYLKDIDESSRPHQETYIPGCDLDLFRINRSPREEPIKGTQRITVITGEKKNMMVKGLDFKLAVASTVKATGKILQQSQARNRVTVNLCVAGPDQQEKSAWENDFATVISDVSKDDNRIKFVFSTMQDMEELRKVLQRASLFIMPLKRESTLFGVEALMAGYAGVPLIVSKNSGFADLLHEILGQDSVIEMKGVFRKDVENWMNCIIVKTLNANDSEQQASEIKDRLLKETSIESSHHKFVSTIVEKSCALLCIEFGLDARVSEATTQTATKLNIAVDGNNNAKESEMYITAFTQYFLYQHSKISLGLLDHLLPPGVKDAWDQLISLLERRGRKVLGINKGSILLQVYCPTGASLDDLNEIVDTGLVENSFANFLSAVGITMTVNNTKLAKTPVSIQHDNLARIGMLHPMFEQMRISDKLEFSSGIGSGESMFSDSATMVPEQKTMNWLEHHVHASPTHATGSMNSIAGKVIKIVNIPISGQNLEIRRYCFSPSNEIIYSQTKHVSQGKYSYSLHHLHQKGKVIIPDGEDMIWSVAFINIDNSEHLVTNQGERLLVFDTTLLNSRIVYEKHIPESHVLNRILHLCPVDEKSVACTHALPIDGCHEIDVLDIRPGKWFPFRTVRAELGWEFVYDMCHTISSDGPQLVLCSWNDESVAGVGLHDGKIRWRITSKEAGVKLWAYSVCADQLGRVFVACPWQHCIYIVSSEDGALLGCLNLDPPVIYPRCVRIHRDKLWVAHMEEKTYRTTGQWKWQISQCEEQRWVVPDGAGPDSNSDSTLSF